MRTLLPTLAAAALAVSTPWQRGDPPDATPWQKVGPFNIGDDINFNGEAGTLADAASPESNP